MVKSIIVIARIWLLLQQLQALYPKHFPVCVDVAAVVVVVVVRSFGNVGTAQIKGELWLFQQQQQLMRPFALHCIRYFLLSFSFFIVVVDRNRYYKFLNS